MNSLILKAGFAALGLSAIVALGGAGTTDSTGKSIFLANKCNTCHSIQAQGIAKAGNESTNAKNPPPDLSGVGLKHQAAWIAKYLQKKETLDDEKHLKKFKGPDEDLATLAAWLESQKKK